MEGKDGTQPLCFVILRCLNTPYYSQGELPSYLIDKQPRDRIAV